MILTLRDIVTSWSLSFHRRVFVTVEPCVGSVHFVVYSRTSLQLHFYSVCEVAETAVYKV